ncbi:MAG TPA: hypothetical protein VM261_23350 [Kofleriaceae bacterium]|nr:hypothetical protein [Kofleriaceae bacterium]
MATLASFALGAAACSRGGASSDPPPPPPPPPSPPRTPTIGALSSCERQPFAPTIPIAEASGAQWMPDGTILVVSDSGNGGAFVTIDGGDGHVVASGKLPLGGPGDDLEGLAGADGMIWAITSSGWMRAWTPRASGKHAYELAVHAYPIDPDDECTVDAVNCGNNYEGLCLMPAASAALGGCAGYAASKASGDLVCLVRDDDGRYVAAPERRIHVSGREALAACDLAADGTIWTGDNLFGRSVVRRVSGGEVVDSAALGAGFPEAMTVAPDGTIYRFSDTGGAPSVVAKYRCTGAASQP